MRLDDEQHFSYPPADVVRAFTTPEFYARLGGLEHIHPPEVVEHETDGDTVRLSIRYKAKVNLPGPAKVFVSDDMLSMVEHATHDLAALKGTFRMVPDFYGGLMSCSGEYVYDATEDGSRRLMEGELRIKVPIVGGRAERVVVSNLRTQGQIVASMVDDWLTG